MPRLASFFGAMSGIKKLTNFIPAITCPTSANDPSGINSSDLLEKLQGFLVSVTFAVEKPIIHIFMTETFMKTT